MLTELAMKRHSCDNALPSSSRNEAGCFILLQLSFSLHELDQQLQRSCELVVQEPRFEVAWTHEFDSACKFSFHYPFRAVCQQFVCYGAQLGLGT